MRRSNFIIKLTSLLAFFAIVTYIGMAIYESQTNPLKTAVAVPGTLVDAAETVGFAAREETVIRAKGSDAAILAAEGRRVAVNDRIAIRYLTGDAVARATEIRETELKIRQLESLLQNGGSEKAWAAAAESSVQALALAAATGDLSAIDEIYTELDAYVMGDVETYDQDELAEALEVQQARLERLSAASGADTVVIAAELSGLFSSTVDGFEGVAPEALRGLTPAELASAFSEGKRQTGDHVGKLVTGIRWFYAAMMDTADAEKLTEGQSANLRFSGDYSGELSMKVEQVGADAGGRTVVLFSCGRALAETMDARSLAATVEFSRISGLVAPKDAVHEEGGTHYVYVLSGLQARRADVEILGEVADSYIVQSVNLKLLSEGTEIIVKANGLYEGKVVR